MSCHFVSSLLPASPPQPLSLTRLRLSHCSACKIMMHHWRRAPAVIGYEVQALAPVTNLEQNEATSSFTAVFLFSLVHSSHHTANLVIDYCILLSYSHTSVLTNTCISLAHHDCSPRHAQEDQLFDGRPHADHSPTCYSSRGGRRYW